MHVSSSLQRCPIIAGAPFIATENIFLSIPFPSKFLVKMLSISFTLVVPYIGFKQQSSSCTSPLLQYLAILLNVDYRLYLSFYQELR